MENPLDAAIKRLSRAVAIHTQTSTPGAYSEVCAAFAHLDAVAKEYVPAAREVPPYDGVFWLAWRPGDKTPSPASHTRAAAESVADERARQSPGQRFFVLQAINHVEVELATKWRVPLEGSEP